MVYLKWVGISAIVIGVLSVATSVLLFITGIASSQKMEMLNAEVPTKFITPTIVIQNRQLQAEPTSAPPQILMKPASPIPENNTEPISQVTQSSKSPETYQKSLTQIRTTSIPKYDAASQNSDSLHTLIIGYGSDNFSKHFHPADWGNSRWHKSDHLRDLNLDNLQQPDITIDQLTFLRMSGLATQMRIPTLGLDAPIEQLEIIDIEGVKQYESPKNVVGRIPTDHNSIESISGWYFGHLESPIKSEGNVFHKLPEIPSYLTNGDPIHIHLISEKKEYVYQAFRSEVVHETELKLYDAGLENIVLVTCVNRPYYDHRQVVTAKLVDIR